MYWHIEIYHTPPPHHWKQILLTVEKSTHGQQFSLWATVSASASHRQGPVFAFLTETRSKNRPSAEQSKCWEGNLQRSKGDTLYMFPCRTICFHKQSNDILDPKDCPVCSGFIHVYNYIWCCVGFYMCLVVFIHRCCLQDGGPQYPVDWMLDCGGWQQG